MTCKLYSGDCNDISSDVTALIAFRPIGYTAPASGSNICTHLPAFGRSSTSISDCTGFGSDFT